MHVLEHRFCVPATPSWPRFCLRVGEVEITFLPSILSARRKPRSIGFDLSDVNGCQDPRKDGATKKVDIAFAWTSVAHCRRGLGGKRRLCGKPCQGRQPPKAGAAGPPLQGLPPSHTRPPRSTADHREAASSAIYARIHAAANIWRGYNWALRAEIRVRKTTCFFWLIRSRPSSAWTIGVN
jgi:hypothetical protein